MATIVTTSAEPEDFLTPLPVEGNNIPVDAVLTVIVRARAVLDLIEDSGHNLEEGFSVDNKTIMNALWSVNGMLRQAEALLLGPNDAQTH